MKVVKAIGSITLQLTLTQPAQKVDPEALLLDLTLTHAKATGTSRQGP